MIQSRAKTTTLMRWQTIRETGQETGASDALPHLIILFLLCALSLVAAVKAPLAFYEMVAWV